MASSLFGGPLGVPQQQGGGIFGSYAPQAGGIFAALKDAASYLGGGGSADNFSKFQVQNQQNQVRQQLMQGLTSEDPAARQQAYVYANMLGLPTDGLQKMQAQQAVPKLLQSMQPTPETANVSAPAVSANLPAVNGIPNNLNLPQLSAPYDTGKMQPGLKIGDALAATGSPELMGQYGPDIIKQQIEMQAKAKRTLSPDEAIAAGFRPGSVVQADPNNDYSVPQASDIPSAGKLQSELWLKNHDPMLGVAQGNLAVSQSRLTLERQKEGDGNFTAPTTVEAADPRTPGQRTQFLAQQNKKTGQWYSGDQNRTPLSDVMLPGGVPGGGRAAAQVGRMIGAAKDVDTGLRNVTQLPIAASTGMMGLLGGKQEAHTLWDATRTVLANQMTPQEVQSTKAMYVGIAKAIGTLDAGGLQTSDTFLKQIGGLLPADGDTHMTKLLKLAELRQQADNALEAQLNGPLLSSQQKVYAKALRASLAKSVPWSPTDVLALDKSPDPNAKISDFAKSSKLGAQAGAHPPEIENLLRKYGQ